VLKHFAHFDQYLRACTIHWMQSNFEEKKLQALTTFRHLKLLKGVSLKQKSTTHFFRKRIKPHPLDLRSFNQVMSVNTKEKYVEAEGLTTFYDLLDATLKYGYMPVVVPEMRNITVGGAISGLGLEASSFQHGMVHENVTEMSVLTGQGEVLNVSAEKHPDLFVTLPNSLGTLGYILKCKMNIQPVKKYVQVEIKRFDAEHEYFETMKTVAKKKDIDFIEGVIFDHNHFVLLIGKFVDEVLPRQQLFDVYQQAWYRFVRNDKNKEAFFTVKDFFWRWDPDAYWGTDRKGFLGWMLNAPLLRHTVLRGVLRSDKLLQLRHLISYHPLFQMLRSVRRALGEPRQEQLVHDVGVDINECADFFDWYKKVIRIYPVWLCPVKTPSQKKKYPLYSKIGEFVVDMGFYASKKLTPGMPDNYYNTLIEDELAKLGAVKGLHSTSFYSWEEFWSEYDQEKYFATKEKYDPQGVFPNLYEKVVGKVTK
jgi:hypothetical protein